MENRWIGVALAAALLAWGCAAVRGPGRHAAPSGDAVAAPARDGPGEPALPPPDAGTPSGSKPAGDPGLESLLIRIQERTASALAAFEAGETDSARAKFHECLDLILDSGYDLATTPRLRAAFLEVMERMNATDLTLLPEPAPPEEGLVAAASEALAEIDPDQPPAEPDSDRSRARRETEEIPFDVPVVVNDAVLSWIEVYQTDLRGRFEEGLRNSGRFLPMIRKIFTEEGLPRDLAHMAHVESSYKPRAYSRAHAMGIWQFIRSTGRLYGLQRDDWVDDRANPEKSTRAAARHLRDLYATFGDWYLVMAAYNGGEGRVQSAIRRTGSRDFWVLRNSRYLRRETKNYIPAILATILIAKDPERYGFRVETAPPWEYENGEAASMTDLRVVAKCAGVELQAVRDLNPELRSLTTPPRTAPYPVRLPVGARETFERNYSALPPEERLQWARHRVRAGETLSQIARRYGTTVPAIQSANGIRNRNRVGENAVLLIPVGPHSGGAPPPAPVRQPGERIVHRVRPGETLSSIAKRYGTDVESLCAWNRLTPTSIIYSGERLAVFHGIRSGGRGAAGAAAPPGSEERMVEYRVRRGDTLTAIARRFRTRLQDLLLWNGLSLKDTIHPGDTLVIYPPD